MRQLPILILAAAALAACDNRAPGVAPADQTPAPDAAVPADAMAPASVGVAVDPQTYVATTASADLYEIRASEMALKRTKNDTVRDFAQRMLTEHRATTKQLTAAAGAAGIAIPAQMMPRHAQMLEALDVSSRGTDPAAFDRLYMEQQRTVHAEGVDLHRNMAGRADLPAELATFARETLPKVEGHLAMLTDMPAGMAGMTGTTATGAAGTGAGATATPPQTSAGGTSPPTPSTGSTGNSGAAGTGSSANPPGTAA